MKTRTVEFVFLPVVLLLLSVLVHASSSSFVAFFNPKESGFWLFVLLNSLLFARYAYYIAQIRFRLYESDWYYKYYDRVFLLVKLFIVKAILPVVFVHFMLMMFVYQSCGGEIFASDYLYTGYLLFIMLLIGYAIFLHKYPQYCLFYRRARQPRINMENWFVQQGYYVVEPTVCCCLRADYYRVDADGQRYISADQIFYLRYDNGIEAFLLSGKRVLLKGNSQILNCLDTRDWFVSLRRNEWVNVLHFKSDLGSWNSLIPRVKYLELAETIAKHYAMPTDVFLRPSKHLKSKVLSHLHRRDSFYADWSDQYLPIK